MAKSSTLKRVLAYVGKYPFALVGSLLFSALSVAASLLVPIFIGDAIDCIIENGVLFDKLKELLIKIGLAAGIAALTQWLASLCNNRISVAVVCDLRRDAFAKISSLPLKYLDARSHGDTVSRVVSDADQFADGLLIGFTQFFTGVLTILGTIVFMLLTDPLIGLVVVFVSPASLFTAKFVATRTYKYFKEQTATRGEQTAFAEEAIAGLKTVQAFAYEKKTEEKFDEINARLEKATMNATFFSSLTNPSTRFINNLIYALVALLGAFKCVGGGFTVGDLTKFLSYANQYTKPFNEISGVVTELKSAMASAARLFELMDEQEEASDAAGKSLPKVEGNVAFERVYFSYDAKKPLIEDLSFVAKPAERVAIVGRTGSGKTTLINLLMRFYETDGGAVTVEGEDVKALKRNALRSAYGMVLQETWLKRGTVRENIKLGREDATDEEMIAAAKAAHAHGFIKRLEKGYDTFLQEDGGNLSEGQKQLLCIARIMLTHPPMLILDEATSSIDTRTERKITDAFHTLMEGRTSFIVAHRLSTVENADVILVMKGGKVVEKGRHQELIEKHGEYYELYRGQFE
ncbi:MAG: ABC transporter ATP-binding protein [Clostridia bacterium]|nr:ABC transporter ATP-binding protein [Clostridia bacterium]